MTKKIKFSSVLFCFFLLKCLPSLSQEIFDISIPWESPKAFFLNDLQVLTPSISGQNLDYNRPNFYWTKSLNSSVNSFFSNVSFDISEALPEEIDYLKSQKIIVSANLNIDQKITKSRHEVFCVVNLFPFIEVEGKIKRISALHFSIVDSAKSLTKSLEKSTVSSSVLAFGSGSWYKISVKEDGVCKIDKAFLESCGISTSGLNPFSINIFGNGDGKLPELNSVKRTDDLAKNAIFVAGESDGFFDDGDYILFYAWGPNRWYPSSGQLFQQDKNIYSDVSYYFININPNDSPLRISSINSSLNPVTNQISSYSYYDTHENDLVSLVGGGQRWYGESFDTKLDQTFNFNVPSINSSSPAIFNVSLALISESSVNTSQTYTINGIIINSSPLPVGDFGRSEITMQLTNPTASLPLEIKIVRNSPSQKVNLDKITLNARRNLSFFNNQFNFRDLASVGVSKVGNFSIENSPNSIVVWDVTNRHAPKNVNGNLSGSTYSFQLGVDSLREFVSFDNQAFTTPVNVGSIDNQNLHGLPQADYLIVTHSDFTAQANRLADLHRSTGLKVHVVTTNQVFNEFSSGMLDPTAIRSFGKMFYDRAVSNPSTSPKYLLLFGDGTYDPKNRLPNNNNYVPTYQVLNSESHINALVTDDYYGLYDLNESISPSDLVDIGVGRLLISNSAMAKQQVDKIEHYMKNGSTLFTDSKTNCCGMVPDNSTFGDWRLKYLLVADDEENGYFVTTDSEPNSTYVTSSFPEMNCDKLYLDAYTQVSNAGGQRYPEVYEAITDRVERGALVINYVGHGGEIGVAEERVITVPQIQDWKNINKLNLMVSATCEFTKFDDPKRVSAGEWVSINPNGGSIALMTTTRSVFFGVNTITGQKFFENVFLRDADNLPMAFGEIMRLTKNASGSTDNKRSFTLIGDPALRIALPKMKIVTDSINSKNPLVQVDTIRALSKITIKGHLTNFSSTTLSDFNGILYPTVFDKWKNNATRGQDVTSPIIPFELQKNSLFKGKVSVKNGYFEFSFIVPKDINYAYGKGKISYYADNGVFDASGQDTNLIIGGVDPNGLLDDVGPEISMYLNNKNFANGGITNENPILMVDLSDENGINTVGNGIGHDITAVLDGKTANPIVLNEYYSANLDSYKSGKIQYNFSKLEKGRHTLVLKAWDVNNNSNEVSLDFVVQEKEELALDHVLNYPNPFTTKTEFYFEHNQAGTELETQIQIFTVSGKLVKTINQAVFTNGFRSSGIPWDGLDEFGDQLGKGVYIYRLKVKSLDGKSLEKTEKLVILR